jgi:hypothetical protein
MIDLRSYLKSQRQPIVDFIQGRYISENVTTEETFNQIATELQRRFIHYHRGDTGGRDQAHNVLTMAIICAMWCGWLSQAEKNRIHTHKSGYLVSKRQ